MKKSSEYKNINLDNLSEDERQKHINRVRNKLVNHRGGDRLVRSSVKSALHLERLFEPISNTIEEKSPLLPEKSRLKRKHIRHAFSLEI